MKARKHQDSNVTSPDIFHGVWLMLVAYASLEYNILICNKLFFSYKFQFYFKIFEIYKENQL